MASPYSAPRERVWDLAIEQLVGQAMSRFLLSQYCKALPAPDTVGIYNNVLPNRR